MNFAAAKELADENATAFTVDGQSKCPLKGTGLIVLVYRQDDQDALGNALVAATEKPKPRDEGSDGEAAEPPSPATSTTTDDGLAKFLPLAPKTYVVGVQKLTDPDGLLVAPTAVEKAIAEHTCPVHSVEVPVWGRPTIELLWKHDDEKVEGAKLALDTGKYDLGTTAADGLAKWTGKDPIKPAEYPCTIDVGGTACQLFSDDGASEIKPPKVTVPSGKKKLTFKVRRPSWVKLAVVRPKGTGTEAVLDAELKITWDDRSVKAFKTAKGAEDAVLADVKDVAVTSSPPTCEVVSLDIADGETYEVVGVTSA